MNNKYAEVMEHVTALRSGPFWELVFSSDLEERYQLGQNDWYRETIRISSLLAIMLLLASYMVELAAGFQPQWYTVVARCLASFGLLCAYIYIQRSLNLTWKYWVVSLNTMLVAGTLLLMARFTPEPIKVVYYSNVFFVEVVVFAFIRMPLNFTSTLGLTMLLMVGGALYLDTMHFELTFHVMFFLLAGTVLAVMVSIKTERMSRESFLKSELIHFEKNHLRALNERLHEQMCLDRVTHLLNRPSFEDRLLSAWQVACQSREPLWLVAIQIEQFAQFNQAHGAESGDDLLREVARCVRHLQGESRVDAARIGGGRFLLYIEQSELASGQLLEKLRDKLLRVAGNEWGAAAVDAVYFSWGRVELALDADRDPRDLIDRMFRHLVEIDDAKDSVCRQVFPGVSVPG